MRDSTAMEEGAFRYLAENAATLLHEPLSATCLAGIRWAAEEIDRLRAMTQEAVDARDQAESDARGLGAENQALRAKAVLKAGPTVCPDCKGSGKVFYYRDGLYEPHPGDCPTCWGVRCPAKGEMP